MNSVAMRTVSILYNRVMDAGCISHTLDHVGEHMKTPRSVLKALDRSICT